MLGNDAVDEELQRGFGLSIKEIEPLLRAGGDAAEMKFMECCRYLWQADGAELTEPFIEALFNKLPEKSRCDPLPADVDDCLRGTRWRVTTTAFRMKPPNSTIVFAIAVSVSRTCVDPRCPNWVLTGY
jgi:hypothetical protein